MKLIVDRGNTLIKLALFNHNELIESLSFQKLSGIQLNGVLDEFEKKHACLGKIDRGLISTVVDDVDSIEAALKRRMTILRMEPTMPVPVKIEYQTINTLGTDRIALAVAGFKMFPNEDVLIVSAGTCITYEFISHDGVYQGGAISPGIGMRFKALNTFTGKLPLVSQIDEALLTGRSTEASIQSGVINGAKAEIRGMISQYESKYPSIKVILTGGDLKYFDKNSKSNIFAISNLILLGLNEILKYNAEL